ncbi:FHA domain-containing protein [Azotobacter armeniacus]
MREHNEDALLCCPRLRLWAVADGMGGHRRGEVASALALDTLCRLTSRCQDLRGAIQGANAAILTAGEAEEGSHGMGTTLVAVRFAGADFQLVWVGDSRAYRIGADSIEQLTCDHSWVQAMIDAGRLTPEEAGRHPRRNVVTQCLGQSRQAFEVELVQGRLGSGELLLLCSDGLTRELSDAQIQQLCAGAATLDALVGMGGNIIHDIDQLADGRHYLAMEYLPGGDLASHKGELCFGDPELSRRHGEFFLKGDVLEIKDLASANGLYVNRKRIENAVLQPGDQVRMGSVTLLVIGPKVEVQQTEDATLFMEAADLPKPEKPKASGRSPVANPLHTAARAAAAPQPEQAGSSRGWCWPCWPAERCWRWRRGWWCSFARSCHRVSNDAASLMRICPSQSGMP